MKLSVSRVCFLIAAFAGMAMATVHLRAERARCAATIATLDAEWVMLRRDWWDLQARAANLKTPEHIRERAQDLQADLVSPEFEVLNRGSVRLASDRAE